MLERQCRGAGVVASFFGHHMRARAFGDTRVVFRLQYVDPINRGCGVELDLARSKNAQSKVVVLADIDRLVTRAIARSVTFSDWQRTGSDARARLRCRACFGFYRVSPSGWCRRNP